jgi:hypothetical protein
VQTFRGREGPPPERTPDQAAATVGAAPAPISPGGIDSSFDFMNGGVQA